MLKVRIIAALIAIILTIGTAYLLPMVVYYYTGFVAGLTKEQRIWFNLLQVVIGAAIAMYGFWRWKKNKPKG